MLSDDDGGQVLLQAGGLVPGQTRGSSGVPLVGAVANVAVHPCVLSQSQVEAHCALR